MQAFKVTLGVSVTVLLCISGDVKTDTAPVAFLKLENNGIRPMSNTSLAIEPVPHGLLDLPTTDDQTRIKRKAKKEHARKGGKKNPEEIEGSGNGNANDDEDAYHVRYETKFAFQNVDEFGLKVKYNKTEHVFYGDTIGNMTQPGNQGNLQPQPGSGQSSPYGPPIEQSAMRQQPMRPPVELITKSPMPMVGEDSLEMIECRKMHFLDNEFEKPIEGMCIMCHRGLGTYRYVEGCNRVDCDEFTPVDVMRAFPDCCPKCKGMLPVNLKNAYKKFTPQGSALKHDWYQKSHNRLDRNKKSTDWAREIPVGSYPGPSAMLRGPPRMPASISFLTGHRAGAGAQVVNGTSAWHNQDEIKPSRPIRD